MEDTTTITTEKPMTENEKKERPSECPVRQENWLKFAAIDY